MAKTVYIDIDFNTKDALNTAHDLEKEVRKILGKGTTSSAGAAVQREMRGAVLATKELEYYLKDVQKEMRDIENATRGMSSVPADLAQRYSDLAQQEAEIIGYIQNHSNKIKQLTLKYTELGRAAASGSGQASSAMRTFLPMLSQMGNIFGVLAGSIPRVFSSLTSGISRITSIIHLPKISKTVNDILRNMRRGILLISGLILGARGLQSILTKIRSSFLAGFKDIYNQDKQFKTQIDTIKQKILDIQVAFASALMPVVQMALPYVKQLLDYILSLIGALSRFISTVTGIQAYTKAIKGLGGAAQSANKQLSKLDELNNVSSGGGGGLSANNGSIGDPEEVESWFTFTRNIIDKIEEMLRAIPWDSVYAKAEKFGRNIGAILNGIFKPSFWNAVGETLAGVLNTLLHFINAIGKRLNFENVGKSIFGFITGLFDKFDYKLFSETLIRWADGFWTVIKTVLTEQSTQGETLAQRIVRMLTTSLSMIDWQEVYTKVEEVAQTLAGVLNDLIDPDLAKEVGKTLGGTLMSIVKFAIAFFGDGGFDWKNLGDTIASGINGFFEQFDGKEMAKGINALTQGIITTFKAVLEQVDWDEVWSDLKTLFQEVDWKSALSVLTVLVAPTLLRIAWDIIKVVWAALKAPLLQFFQTVIWPEISAFFETILGNLPGFFSTIGGFITTALELLIEFLGIWQIIAGLGESISLLFGKDFLGASASEWEESSPIALLLKGITGNFDAEAWDEVWFEFFDGIVKFFTEKIPEFIQIGSDIADGIIQGIIEFSKKGFSLVDLFNAIMNAVKSIFGIASPAKEMYGVGENIVLGILEGFNLVDFAQKMNEWWTNNVAPWFTLEKWTEAVTNIKNAVVNVWTSARTWWSENVQSWWTNNVSPWFTLNKWLELLSPVKDAFSSVFTSAANIVVNILNNIIGALEGLMNNGIAGLVNGIGDKINSKLPADKQIPTFSNLTLPRIPALASGTVVPASMKPFLAQLGDNNTEAEVVSPISTMKEAFLEAMEMSGGFGGGEIHIHVDVDGREIAKAVVKENDIYRKSTGRSLLAY